MDKKEKVDFNILKMKIKWLCKTSEIDITEQLQALMSVYVELENDFNKEIDRILKENEL